jgi:hypothetical protein
MSKAIYGHMGGTDALLVAEVTRLRRRVRELEDQVAAYESELMTQPVDADLVSLREHDIDVALRELGTAEPVSV